MLIKPIETCSDQFGLFRTFQLSLVIQCSHGFWCIPRDIGFTATPPQDIRYADVGGQSFNHGKHSVAFDV